MSRLATRWTLFLVVAVCASLAAGVLAWDWYSVVSPEEFANAHYVGRDTCAKCHQQQYNLWHGSDHDRAMEVHAVVAVHRELKVGVVEAHAAGEGVAKVALVNRPCRVGRPR